jgi:4-hydroxy-3-methylbut-2-enyl diphosphate reductase
MKIHLARHHGMCFGVRDALRKTHEVAVTRPATVLGQLVHNPAVSAHLRTLGVHEAALEAVGESSTADVVITAHGAADLHRRAWADAGYRITDTTCPLVRKAHSALALLVAKGYAPVVIGKKGHVEVRGLTGDFPGAVVIETEADLEDLPVAARIGVVAQTTQPLARVQNFVAQIKACRPGSEVRFIDTVCQPTKERQGALEALCRECEVVIVIGGRNSNNTRELTASASALGVVTHQIEGPEDLDPRWFAGIDQVGVTAGTSTLDETVEAVMQRLRLIAAATSPLPRHGLLRLFA